MSEAVRWSVVVGLVVAAVTATGIGARATYGAQVSGDEPQYLLSALSLWEDGDLDISDERAAERYRPFHEVGLDTQTRPLEDGRRISPHNPGLPLLLAVPMGLGGWVAAKAALAGLAGLLAGVVTWTAAARLGVRPTLAAGVVAVFALSPPLAVYATQVYPELPAALAVAVAVAVLLGPAPLRWEAVWTVAAMVVVLPWLGIKYAPVAAVLAAALLPRLETSQRMRVVGGLAAAGAIYGAAHLWLYGGLTPYATGDHFVGGQLTVVGTEPNLWGRSSRLVGLLADRGFGIGVWQPAYLLLPAAAAWALARRLVGRRLLVGLVGVGWVTATFVALTMHGWWFPGRQLVVVLPAAVLLIAAWAGAGGWRPGLTLGVGAVGVVAFGFLVAEGLAGDLTWIVDFGATANPLYGAVAAVAPNYMTATAGTWVLHGVWLVAVVALGWLGWRDGRRPAAEADAIGDERPRERITA